MYIGLPSHLLLYMRYKVMYFVSCLFCIQLPEVVARHCRLPFDRKGMQSSLQLLSKVLPLNVLSDMIQLCACVCVCGCASVCVCLVKGEASKCL